ncbi:MAG: lipid-A-disaccharide synthase [bacterium]|nr:MAG: lipid-A-disaccharide synthase [bacterium]
MKTILLTCGETSGEHNASRLVSQIKKQDPSCRILAMGGERLAEAGADVIFPMHRYAVMGFFEVLTKLPRFVTLERRLRALIAGGIDLFIPVDYPGMNLRLAGYARRKGTPVMYFISPQVWAWGMWRMRTMRKSIDLMVAILPFEVELYRRAGIPATFVGHPLIDEIDAPAAPKEVPRRGEAFKVVCFPGSRRQEVERILPPMLGAIRIIKERFPQATFRIGLAPLIRERSIRIPPDMKSYLDITGNGIAELSDATLVLAASGTVTLQTALTGTPAVVLYRTSPFTYLLGKLLVRVDSIAMPNVLSGRRTIPELIQGDATPQRIAGEAVSLLTDGDRYRQVSADLLALRSRLRGDGGMRRVSEIALQMAGGVSVDDIVET